MHASPRKSLPEGKKVPKSEVHMNKFCKIIFQEDCSLSNKPHCKVQLNRSLLSGQLIWQTFKSHWLEDEYSVSFGIIAITTLVLVIFFRLPMILGGWTASQEFNLGFWASAGLPPPPPQQRTWGYITVLACASEGEPWLCKLTVDADRRSRAYCTWK